MSENAQMFVVIAAWIIAICFVVMAMSLVILAIIGKKVLDRVRMLDKKVVPIIATASEITEQGKEMSIQFNEMSRNLTTATQYFADSAGLVKEEVAELKLLVGVTADTAKDKVALVSQTIDRTQNQVTTTADFIQDKVVEPAAELAAVMAGVRKGLEVLFAPSPKQIDRAYQDDELFIG